VEVQFRLLDEEDRARGSIEALDENGQHLGDAEANVGEVHPGRGTGGSDLHLVFLSVLRDLSDLKLIDEFELVEFLSDELLEWLLPLSRPGV
jgi:hypothetical protein